MSDYKELMVLHYFNNVGASYSYRELLMIFGFQTEQLDLLIKKLLKIELLKIDGYLKITEKGICELIDNNLDGLKFDNIEIDDIFTEIPMEFSYIYVPKRFSKSYK